ncbi:MAG: CHAT domain-containing protein, partial [Chloroflexota bacterium]|nr:CHAT domain-containing protein [Chloroflexota bacterium]
VKMVREALQPDNEGIAPAFGFLEKSEMEQLPEYVARAFEHAGNDSRLSLSFAMGQPLKARSRGRHTRSIYTLKTLQVSVDRYAKRAKDAMRDPNNLRFQVGGIGRDLWRELFLEHPKVERTYIEARAKSRYLSLVFETPREFLRLPLEFVRSENPPEYLVIQHPLARFLYNANPMRKAISPSMLAQTKSLRILIVASNTKPLIDGVDTEVQELSKYLKSQTFIHVDVTLIPTERAAYERVRTELRKQDYDILHYAGHGSYRSDSPEESCLYFWANENREGDIVEMRADELKILFGDSNARLVYLSSCYGTATGAREKLLDDDFLGLADVVSQAGVPSVLGFRWPVSDDGAVKMSLAFYRSLLKQGSPEIALWRARRELAAWNRNDTTWLSPILIHQI